MQYYFVIEHVVNKAIKKEGHHCQRQTSRITRQQKATNTVHE